MINLYQIEESDFSILDYNATRKVGSLIASSIYPKGGIFVEVDMESKICFKCKERKGISNFRQYKSGKNKGYFNSYCQDCMRIYRSTPEIKEKKAKYNRLYLKANPWLKTYFHINARCKYDKSHRYLIKGIKALISPQELKQLWFRDKAYLMRKPSIDRIDPKKDYIFDNCRFIELKLNLTRREDNKLSFKLAQKIREELKENKNRCELAIKYGVSPQFISQIKHNKWYKPKTYYYLNKETHKEKWQ